MNSIIEIKSGAGCIDWNQLTELYAQTGLVGNFGVRRDLEKIKQAFNSSYRVISAWDGAKLVGAGRTLSDGLCYCMVYDVGVLPEYRRKGVASAIFDGLLKDCETMAVFITAHFGLEDLSQQKGFKRHKNAFARYPVHNSPYLEA